jgi:catechol 2,3-dioxygenase-like lactoylglutathione lyase family enzyme
MVGTLGLLAVLAFATPAVVAQPAGVRDQAAGRARAVGAIGLTVSDLTRSVAFYRDVLGFEEEAQAEIAGAAFEESTGLPGARARVAVMRLGEERLELTEYGAPTGRPAPADGRSNDAWFQHVAIVTSDIEQGHLWLLRHGARPVSPAPQRLPDWNPAAGGIKAFYFRDPDGHPLELIEFPADKGDARWRRASEGIFLGIDHTAIVVRDTATSLRFYRDALGLRVAGESLNWGPEQERLNDVPGARLRITALRAPAGPGVELLEYLEPRTGRPAPPDTAVNDLVHWHTTVLVDGTARERLVRDPDQHVVRLIGPERGQGRPSP